MRRSDDIRYLQNELTLIVALERLEWVGLRVAIAQNARPDVNYK